MFLFQVFQLDLHLEIGDIEAYCVLGNLSEIRKVFE